MELQTLLYNIGNALHYIRKNLHLPSTTKIATQEEIAAFIGKSDKSISKYENGTVNISIGIISSILSIFNLSLMLVVVSKKPINGDRELYSHLVEINKLLSGKDELCVRKVLDALGINLNLE